ncbi:MAG: hypothetical protein NUW13_16055 [candidate division KSB1 bacterium]|jgi:hypothetical protein|nr:hypothetical protein [candidate division KSB1 bacterium]MDH7475676.1 hypothetical protein [Anaerolineae bacterium]
MDGVNLRNPALRSVPALKGGSLSLPALSTRLLCGLGLLSFLATPSGGQLVAVRGTVSTLDGTPVEGDKHLHSWRRSSALFRANGVAGPCQRGSLTMPHSCRSSRQHPTANGDERDARTVH